MYELDAEQIGIEAKGTDGCAVDDVVVCGDVTMALNRLIHII